MYDKQEIIGVLDQWDLKRFLFLEHFAIHEEHRNKGFGAKVIERHIAASKIPVILEVESPETSKLASRRIKFWERLGFKLNAFDYIQPSRCEGVPPLHMLLMSYPNKLSGAEFMQARDKMHTEAYGLHKPLLAI